MTTVIAESHGVLFGFCSQACARRWRDKQAPPNDNSDGASNGCWLCGRNLAGGNLNENNYV